MKMILEDLQNKIALVTGTAQGIGNATAKALLSQNTSVLGIDRDVSTINHQNYTHYQCNLQSTEEINKAFRLISSHINSLDYVVNVAGMDPKYSIEEGDESHWDQIVNLNLKGYYSCIRSSLELLKKGTGKSIVNLSSINYRLGVPGRSIYSSTKAGIIGLTTGLSRELGRYGIRINCISPGWIFTERQNKEYFDTGNGEKDKKHLEDLYSKQSLEIKISPDDIANHVLFLLSEASRATTGHNMIVDGGWLLE